MGTELEPFLTLYCIIRDQLVNYLSIVNVIAYLTMSSRSNSMATTRKTEIRSVISRSLKREKKQIIIKQGKTMTLG